jgi:pimeloyl-ACP methyl ester carboxylesterase
MIVRAFGFFNVIPRYTDDEEGWIQPLREQGYQIVRFRWSGKSSPSSIRTAATDLSILMRHIGSVTVISCSLGTQVAMLAKAGHEHVTRLVSLCGVYGYTDTSFPVIDIRSADDRFANLSHSILNAFPSRTLTNETIILERIRHDEFGLDTIVSSGTFRGMRLSDVLGHCLAEQVV